MAKPNYTFEKRQKEIAKKKKKEEKRLKKMEQASEETDAEQSPLISEQDTSIDGDTWDKNLRISQFRNREIKGSASWRNQGVSQLDGVWLLPFVMIQSHHFQFVLILCLIK